MAGSIDLKWGTIKAWSDLDEVAVAALQRFSDLGMSASAMQQEMTPQHVAALCKLIDAVDEPIVADWSGETMTRDEAKKYVREYSQKREADQ